MDGFWSFKLNQKQGEHRRYWSTDIDTLYREIKGNESQNEKPDTPRPPQNSKRPVPVANFIAGLT